MTGVGFWAIGRKERKWEVKKKGKHSSPLFFKVDGAHKRLVEGGPNHS